MVTIPDSRNTDRRRIIAIIAIVANQRRSRKGSGFHGQLWQ
ncbi:hypothetical protein [Hominifimenecus microfluidus]|nr:hypothetical protein [Hominifimenecus microfluidus]